MRWLVILAFGGGLYLALCGLLFAIQRRLIFPAPTERAHAAPGAVLEVSAGAPVLWMPAPGEGPVVVHFHGNAEQIARLAPLGTLFVRRGVGFLAVEYPGYPGAAGSPSEASILEAGRRALAHLTGPLGVSRHRVVLQGRSIGSGVAVALAAEGWGQALVLLSPYTSLADVAASAMPLVPVRLLLRDRFDAASSAASVHVPTLIVHGARDEVIPFELGRELSTRFAAARLVSVEGAGHNDLWDHAPTEQVVLDFVLAPSKHAGAEQPRR
jgi:uncharacterized protein